MPEKPASPPQPNSEHKRLGAFVGTWRTAGTIRATESSPAAKIHATDIYEWVPGEFFLEHRWNAEMPSGETSGVEIISYDAWTKTYPMHSYDNQGNENVMQATVQGEKWTYLGDSLRFTGAFQNGGKTFVGLWEQKAEDGKSWKPWMDVNLTKVN